MALVLAGVGVVAVFAGDVSRRRKEIGIRLALGAGEGAILRLLVAASMRHAAAGLALGCLAAMGAGYAMKSLLFGVGPADPVSFAAVAGLVLGLAMSATALPAWLTLRSSPLRSLRE
jgi:putative ABC transport system permease protein